MLVYRPETFRELALRIATSIYQDIHVNLAGVTFFTVAAYGILHPEVKDQCQQIALIAGTYLFGAAKSK